MVKWSTHGYVSAQGQSTKTRPCMVSACRIWSDCTHKTNHNKMPNLVRELSVTTENFCTILRSRLQSAKPKNPQKSQA